MFGYVKAFKPELKMAEYETYKAVYCSLCRTLGRRYGLIAKMTLSYDYTFLAMMRLALTEKFCGYSKMRCTFNPLCRCSCLADKDDEALDYAAAVSVILFYHKIRDNIADSGFFGKLGAYLLLPFASSFRKKAAKRYGDVDGAATKYMDEQLTMERSGTTSTDAAAEPTARFLSFIFSRGMSGDDERILREMGMLLGRWIYVADALDDLADDVKHGSFNVIAHKNSLKKDSPPNIINAAKQNAAALLYSYNDGLNTAYNLLKCERFSGIIGNIIYMGMPESTKNILSGKEKGKRKDERSL